MAFLRLVFDWFVESPALLLSYLIVCLLGFAPLVATTATWVYFIKYLEGHSEGRPRKFSTWIVVAVAAVYVFLVTGLAVYELPRAIRLITAEN
jgi:uncharacterized membrane protein YidH (DUF202 family)